MSVPIGYVQASVYDVFVEKLQAAMAQLVVGPGDAAGVTQGPLIDEAALLKVETHIEDALAKGAHLVAGGARHELGGSFFPADFAGEYDAKYENRP